MIILFVETAQSSTQRIIARFQFGDTRSESSSQMIHSNSWIISCERGRVGRYCTAPRPTS